LDGQWRSNRTLFKEIEKPSPLFQSFSFSPSFSWASLRLLSSITALSAEKFTEDVTYSRLPPDDLICFVFQPRMERVNWTRRPPGPPGPQMISPPLTFFLPFPPVLSIFPFNCSLSFSHLISYRVAPSFGSVSTFSFPSDVFSPEIFLVILLFSPKPDAFQVYPDDVGLRAVCFPNAISFHVPTFLSPLAFLLSAAPKPSGLCRNSPPLGFSFFFFRVPTVSHPFNSRLHRLPAGC